MSARSRLVALAVVVAALGVGLLLLLRGGDDPDEAASPGAPAADPKRGPLTAGGPGVTVPPPAPATGGEPGADPAEATGERPARRPPTTYVMEDGTVVRDHRRNPSPPVAIVPTPPAERTMSSEVSARVLQALSPKVRACTAAVPADARGADPFVYVNLRVQVAAGTLRTTDVVPVARDVEGPASEALLACVRDGLAALEVDAAGEPDREQYVLQYPIRIR